MAKANFAEILDRQMDDIDEPQDVPQGTWRLRFVGEGKWNDPKDDDSNGYFLFPLAPVEAQEDVDPDELAAFEPDLEGARIFHRMYVGDRRDEWAVKQLLVKAGVETTGRTLIEGAKEVKGYEIMGEVVHKPQDDERVFVNVRNFQPIE